MLVENRPHLVACIEHIEELKQHEGRERQLPRPLLTTALHAVVLHRQRARHQRDAASKDLRQARTRQDGLGRGWSKLSTRIMQQIFITICSLMRLNAARTAQFIYKNDGLYDCATY